MLLAPMSAPPATPAWVGDLVARQVAAESARPGLA
jgi:hypothetical protein